MDTLSPKARRFVDRALSEMRGRIEARLAAAGDDWGDDDPNDLLLIDGLRAALRDAAAVAPPRQPYQTVQRLSFEERQLARHALERLAAAEGDPDRRIRLLRHKLAAELGPPMSDLPPPAPEQRWAADRERAFGALVRASLDDPQTAPPPGPYTWAIHYWDGPFVQIHDAAGKPTLSDGLREEVDAARLIRMLGATIDPRETAADGAADGQADGGRA